MKISNNKFTPESVSLFNDTWSGKKEWTKLEEKIPSMMNYNSVNEDGELNTSKYGVVVKNVELTLDHRLIMKSGMDYLVEEGKSVSFPDFLNEYHSWFQGFYPKVSNKQDIQKSGKILSPEMIKQYQSGFVKHIRSYVDPNFTDTTTMSFDDIYGSVSGSVE